MIWIKEAFGARADLDVVTHTDIAFRRDGGLPIARGADCALSLDLFLLKRSSSLSLLLLLDEPQPRKTNGGDHHHDQSGVFNHRSCPELMLMNHYQCTQIEFQVDPHQRPRRPAPAELAAARQRAHGTSQGPPGLKRSRTNGGHCHPRALVKNSSTLTHRRITAVGQAAFQVLFELRVSLPVSARTRLSFAGRLLARSKTSAIFGDWHIGTTMSSGAHAFWRFLSSADYLVTYAQ